MDAGNSLAVEAGGTQMQSEAEKTEEGKRGGTSARKRQEKKAAGKDRALIGRCGPMRIIALPRARAETPAGARWGGSQ